MRVVITCGVRNFCGCFVVKALITICIKCAKVWTKLDKVKIKYLDMSVVRFCISDTGVSRIWTRMCPRFAKNGIDIQWVKKKVSKFVQSFLCLKYWLIIC